MIIITMGVSGSGKTTIGRCLATVLGWPFYDGDDFHPQANVDKMAQGMPLTDADREPWLQAMHEHIATLIRRGENAVLACSALKRAYRRQIVGTLKQVHFVYLRGSFDLIQSRLAARQGHFMPSDLLASQFDTLEEPEHAVTVDVTYTPAEIVEHIRQALALPRGTA